MSESLVIELPEDLARMVREKVDSGNYASSSEVIGDALRRMERLEREQSLNSIRQAIATARADPRRYSAHEVRTHFDAKEARRIAGE